MEHERQTKLIDWEFLYFYSDFFSSIFQQRKQNKSFSKMLLLAKVKMYTMFSIV